MVNILPGDYSSPIQCQVRVVDLDTPPPYCALSYVWGERSDGNKIFVDQTEMIVSLKLYIALQHLRSHDESRTFWVDAICINQVDNAEKSAQVRKMQEIYGRSKEILIWLGPEGDGSASAMALATTISTYWADHGLDLNDAETEFRSKSLADLSTLLDQCNCKFDSAPVEAFRLLLARDWFERVWTVQEAAAPVKTKTIQCGNSKIDWWGFIAAAKFLSHAIVRPDLKVYFPHVDPVRPTSLRGLFNLDHLQRLIESGRYQTDLLGTLANYRHYKATEKRDKVYALLSLVTEALPDVLVCDYSLDAPTIYLKVAEHCILYRDSLECLGYCNPSSRDLELPSWVPNWSDPSARHPLAYSSKHRSKIGGLYPLVKKIYFPSADRTCQKRHVLFSILQAPKLVIEGFCMDKIMATSLPYYPDAAHASKS